MPGSVHRTVLGMQRKEGVAHGCRELRVWWGDAGVPRGALL